MVLTVYLREEARIKVTFFNGSLGFDDNIEIFHFKLIANFNIYVIK